MAKAKTSNPLMPVAAGLLAWLVPGAGHLYLRRTLRGIIMCLCINGLFWAGVAVGGVFTVDPIGQRWWFAAQMCAGASCGAAWYRQKRVHRDLLAEAELLAAESNMRMTTHQAYTQLLVDKDYDLNYPSDTVARAYSGVAGMLNLLAIFDAVLLGAIGRLGEPPPEKKQPPKERSK